MATRGPPRRPTASVSNGPPLILPTLAPAVRPEAEDRREPDFRAPASEERAEAPPGRAGCSTASTATRSRKASSRPRAVRTVASAVAVKLAV